MDLKTYNFNPSNIEIEVKDLKFIKELPRLFIKPHRANFHQIAFIFSGQAHFRIDFHDIVIKAGQQLVIHAGQVCRFDLESAYAGKMILFTNTFFSATGQDTNFLYTSELLSPLGINSPLSLNSQQADTILSLLEKELKRGKDNFQAGIARNYLRILLLESERKLIKSRLSVLNTLVRVFCNEVERNFRENREVQFYADQLGVSEKKLSREVKTVTGQTPKAYITARVFLEAKRLLSYSSLSVKEISFNLGFCEISNFSNFFLRHEKVSPAEFRRSNSQ